jgi:hypothetical protein
MNRKIDRLQTCTRADAVSRLRQAELYLEVANLIMGEKPVEGTVATGNAVLGAIAAADAICCASAGARYRGGDHRRAAEHLEQVTGEAELARVLRQVIDLKDAGHYGLADVSLTRAKAAIRGAARVVAVAQERVPRTQRTIGAG